MHYPLSGQSLLTYWVGIITRQSYVTNICAFATRVAGINGAWVSIITLGKSIYATTYNCHLLMPQTLSIASFIFSAWISVTARRRTWSICSNASTCSSTSIIDSAIISIVASSIDSNWIAFVLSRQEIDSHLRANSISANICSTLVSIDT